MRFVDEFRDAELAAVLATRIDALVEGMDIESIAIMEVCGGHTHTIHRYGVQDHLPEQIELIHGPGCPVCVIPMGRIDDGIAIAEHDDVVLTCFGDMMRVPGSAGSFLDAKARGADIRWVYSPLDALRIARTEPDRHVVFFAIGFETTTPSTALTVQQARAEGLTNFSVFCNHVTVNPAIAAILDAPDVRIDGFIGPGHVSTVIGCRPYEWIARDRETPLVCSGFEPLDLLASVHLLVAQLAEGRCEVENQYTRAVTWDGNERARRAIDDVFEERDTFEWRGLGTIPRSALRLRDHYADLDAERRFVVPGASVADPKACRCGDVLRGALRPWECGVFGTACTPESPIGACMVSSEGACAAAYTYGHDAAVRLRSRSGSGS